MKKRNVMIAVLGIIVLLCFCVPILLDCFIFGNNIPSNLNNGEWASFLGSYLGGVLGGIATLVAVIATIHYNRENIDREAKELRNERISRSAVIVYYDFKFSINDVLSFMNAFWSEKKSSPNNEQLDESDLELFIKTRSRLSQMYLYEDWIGKVAVLMDSRIFDKSEIETIYETYGNLMTIKKCLDSTNQEICENAYKAMTKIVTNVNADKSICDIMSKLQSNWIDQKSQ